MSHFHTTKIIATMWPAIDKETVLSKVVNNIDVFRINLSHGDEETKRKYIDIILKLDSSKTVMLDLRGPEIRTKNKEDLVFKTWQKITIAYSEFFQNNPDQLLIDYPNLQRIPVGTVMSIDNDTVKIEIIEQQEFTLTGKIVHGGTLGIQNIVDFENYIPKLPFLTEKDKEQIIWWVENKINMISVGYLRDAENILHIKSFLESNGWSRVKVIAKIETAEALDNYVSILDVSDGVMISREKIAILSPFSVSKPHKNDLIRLANIHWKPIIMSAWLSVTGKNNEKTIETLIEEIGIGVDAVMLTKESAVGEEPLDTILMAYELVNDPTYQPKTTYALTDINHTDDMLVADYIINLAYQASKELDVKAIICPTHSGYAPARIAALKPPVPIIAFTKNDEAYRYMNMLWWVKWYKIASTFDLKNVKQIWKEMIRILFKWNIALDDKIIVLHSQWRYGGPDALNGVELYKFKDI